MQSTPVLLLVRLGVGAVQCFLDVCAFFQLHVGRFLHFKKGVPCRCQRTPVLASQRLSCGFVFESSLIVLFFLSFLCVLQCVETHAFPVVSSRLGSTVGVFFHFLRLSHAERPAQLPEFLSWASTGGGLAKSSARASPQTFPMLLACTRANWNGSHLAEDSGPRLEGPFCRLHSVPVASHTA